MEMLQERTEDGLLRFPTQTALAEYVQLPKQYVGQIVNIQTSGVGGIGADIIEHLMQRVGLLPDWFFAEWSDEEPRPSYKDYLASTKRIARTVQTLQRQQVADREMMREVLARLAELEAERGVALAVSKRKRGR
jgi:transcriptional regulator with XRE-family HTH domain